MTNWKQLIAEHLDTLGHSFDDVEDCTLSDAALTREFVNERGHPKGEAFTAWTKNLVIFPSVRDGVMRIESKRRDD